MTDKSILINNRKVTAHVQSVLMALIRESFKAYLMKKLIRPTLLISIIKSHDQAKLNSRSFLCFGTSII